MPSSRLSFDAPAWLIAAAVVAAIAGIIANRWRLAAPRASLALSSAGMLLMVLAAGLPQWRRPAAGEVAVLVDLSPSTRTASFRDRAALETRLRQLLGDVPYRICRFAAGPAIDDDGSPLAELPATSTHLPAIADSMPGARAVLLFSDGRCSYPASFPPVYAVVDERLSRTADARVASLTIDGSNAVAATAVEAGDPALQWSLDGVTDGTTVALRPGSVVLRRAFGTGTRRIGASISAGDPWPENDRLSIATPPPMQRQRWYVTTAASAPAGYVRTAPADVPSDTDAYLSASAIVLDNVSAGAIAPAAIDRLAQYVRDLGGGLVILGGDRAFAAGGYIGTALDATSPLSSAPPRPSTHWIILTDGSGSMNAESAGTRTRWQSATAALVRLLPAIPAEDPVTLGHFAADATWWTGGRRAAETRTLPLPPAGVAPGGPTNLRPAIEAAAARHDPALPGQLLVLSDAETDLGDVASLVATLKSRNIRLHVLAVGDGNSLPALRSTVEQTGGSLVQQTDVSRWTDAAAELLKSAGDRRWITDPAESRFVDDLASLPPRRVSGWNRTWLKPRAQLLAESGTSAGGESIPMAARWAIGEGNVAAVAFAPSDAEREAIVRLVATAPRDPRFSVTVDPGGRLKVRVDAIDSAAPPASRYLNQLDIRLSLTPADDPTGGNRPASSSVSAPQSGPGRYEVEIDAPSRPMVASLSADGRPIDRFAVAGRYPREFDAVGIDRESLRSCVDRFGGAIVEVDQIKPIDFRWPMEAVPLSAWLAGIGAAFLGLALLWWRWA